jgi:5-methylcytosine-specific restriction endonuclease McrA
MATEAARRVREGLAELIRLVNDEDTPTADARTVLEESKAFGAQVAVLQADAAALVAVRDRHGDGGVGVLAQAAGLSRRDAASQVKTAEKLQEMSAVRDALETGEISVANAKTLATTCEKTSAEQVEQDGDLLAQAAVLSPEQFSREAGRWAAKRQVDDGEELYRRQRTRRRLSFWNGDDGMVHLRGELDPVTGAKVHKRFLLEAERLRRADLRSPGGDKRSRNQRMADALDTLTSHGSIYGEDSKAGTGANGADGASSEAVSGDAGGNRCGCGGRPSADITIVQHLDADGTAAFAEVPGGGVIPRSVLEEHFCNARIKGVVFSSEGVPLWHGHAKRFATKAQMNALRARYGACGGCGADMWICSGHHVRPVSEGGPTNIDNMMLLCWACHQKVHHHGWREVPDGRGLYTIEPPERIRHGPARAPDPPVAQGPPDRRPARSHSEKAARRSPAARAGPANSLSSGHAEPLFAVD